MTAQMQNARWNIIQAICFEKIGSVEKIDIGIESESGGLGVVGTF